MSNRLSKGRVVAGSFAADKPGFIAMNGIPFSCAATSYNITSFSFPVTAVVQDVFVKITSLGSAATSQTMMIGLQTNGAASSGFYNGLVNGMNIGTTGIHVGQPSSSSAVGDTVFTYGYWFIASSSGSNTVLRDFPVTNSTVGYTLTYTLTTTVAAAGSLYPIYYELL